MPSAISLNGSPLVPLHRGQDLLGAILDAGLSPMYLCMAGSCGRCRIRVSSGQDALTARSSAEEFHRCVGDHRLACQARLAGEAEIHVHQPA